MENYKSLTTKELSLLLDADVIKLKYFINKNLKIKPDKKHSKHYSFYKCRIIIKEWFLRKRHLKQTVFESKINKE